jgi:predicted lipoprotein with Yx(FWY)xxD motif
MTRTLRISIGILLVAAVPGAALATAASTTTTAAKAKSPALKVRKTGLGKIVVDKNGRTLYAFGHDKKDKSRCSGQCASFWPPAAAPKKPTVGSGITKSKLKVIKRGDGTKQLSYNGHPLYRYVGDGKPGDTNGENINAFGGIWDVLSAGGKRVTKAPSTSSGGGSSSPGGGSTGYPSYPGY